MNYNKNYYAVIMAGGVGSRFWPVSTGANPKQFQDMMGVGSTLIQLTYNRLSKIVRPENILILTNYKYREIVKEQLPLVEDEQIITEPAMRNTAPCILLAALKIKKNNPGAVMLVAPSDHWIDQKEFFAEDINKSLEAASSQDVLITLGVKPTFPNTGYGYIQYNRDNESTEEKDLLKVLRFTEKPTLRNARKFLEEGNYLWNSGIFIWKAAYIIECFKNYAPKMFRILNDGKELLNEKGEEGFLKEKYPDLENISIDYAILERSDNVYVLPASFGWDDLGTWGALYSKLAKDEQKNAVVNAQLLPMASKNNIVYSGTFKTVILDGLEGYIIVDDGDVLMIVPKEKEQEIKTIRSLAIEKFGENLG